MTAVPEPRHQADLFGQGKAERSLLDNFRGGRLHHATLLHGPRGVGKATLAYRFARFLLKHPDPRAPAVRNAEDLTLDANDPVFRQTASGAHPDLLVLEPAEGKDVVSVEGVRRLTRFFNSTAGAGGWRVAVVDPADALNIAAANALLKTLEEPPERSLILLVAHAPGRLPVTIRSRAQRLALDPLGHADLARAAGLDADAPDAALLARLSGGSVARVLALRDGAALEHHRWLDRVAGVLPKLDVEGLHGVLDGFSGHDGRAAFGVFSEILLAWLETAIRFTAAGEGPPGLAPLPGELARWVELWEKTSASLALTETLNLDRKHTLLPVFLEMAEAARARA